MERTIVRTAFVLVGLVAGIAQADPQFSDARLTRHAAADGLQAVFESLKSTASEPVWIGYAVPATARRGDECCNRCLERGGSWNDCPNRSGDGKTAPLEPIRLEAPAEVAILFRVERKDVERIENVQGACAVDAGGRIVHWLTDVKPAESLALLASFVSPSTVAERKPLMEAAMAAIAFHRDSGADDALRRFAAAGPTLAVRRQAVFWLGVARGRRGFEALQRLVGEDPLPELREHAVFALSQNHEPGALSAVLDVARRDASAHVRGQALFWLSQRAGERAVRVITQAVEDDPDTAVKERAVFALSQLPKDQGVPLLIQQARTNRNPAVRRQAVFWLGQSGDARALAFFEEVLGR